MSPQRKRMHEELTKFKLGAHITLSWSNYVINMSKMRRERTGILCINYAPRLVAQLKTFLIL